MLTTTADDDEFVLSQELCLETVSRKGGKEWSGILWTWHVAPEVVQRVDGMRTRLEAGSVSVALQSTVVAMHGTVGVGAQEKKIASLQIPGGG